MRLASPFSVRSGLIAVLVFAAALGSLVAQPRYGLQDLGVVGTATASFGSDINELGQVAGSLNLPPDSPSGPPPSHAFLWLPQPQGSLAAGMHDLGAVGGGTHRSFSRGLNEHTQVVGGTQTGELIPGTSTLLRRGFVWSAGTMSPLPFSDPLLYTSSFGANEINNDGAIVTTVSNSTGCLGELHLRVAAYGLPAGIHPVPPLDSVRRESEATGINNLGHVVGGTMNACDVPGRHVFLWLQSPAYGLPAGIHDLTPDISNPNHLAIANAISDQGHIVGQIQKPTGIFLYDPFLWLNGVRTMIPAPAGAATAWANDVNSFGLVIGNYAAGFNQPSYGFLWFGTTTYRLQDLLVFADGWTMRGASGINDRGQITGYAERGGLFRAVILDPILFADGFESGDFSAWSEVVP